MCQNNQIIKIGNQDLITQMKNFTKIMDITESLIKEQQSLVKKFAWEPEMVFVQGGQFLMGTEGDEVHYDDDDDEEDDIHYDYEDDFNSEKPAHIVTINGFYMATYLVTQSLWQIVMGNYSSRFKMEDIPVEDVNYDECQLFVEKLNELTSKKYRLPTEAEWEFAARGGNKSKGYKYAGSDDADEVAWHFNNSDRKTHPVGLKKANELGLYDMSGNVYEWCNDWYGKYSAISQINPNGPTTGSERVLRGGCCSGFDTSTCTRNRHGSNPSYNYFEDEFRFHQGVRLAHSSY